MIRRSGVWGHKGPVRRAARTAAKVDGRLFAKVARAHTPALDRSLPRLSWTANHSVLWFVIAGFLAALGGRRGKRAAGRGTGSILVTSLIVNLFIKPLIRRTRPSLRNVPLVRQLDRQPLTTSFPSGHAASATAFATGVAIESRWAGAGLAPLAAAVAYSRVYVGVHYPADVAAGAMIGAGVAWASRKQFPHVPAVAEVRHPSQDRRPQPPGGNGEDLTFVLNPDAGSPFGRDAAGILERDLPATAVIETEGGEALVEGLREAAERGGAIGVAGGDGSVGAGAEVAAETGRALLLFPAGTLNHLARDLRIEGPADSVEAFKDGDAVAIDLGRIAGRTFINTAMLGAYPRLLELRQRLESRIGRWPAHLAAVTWTLFRAKPLRLEIDGEPRRVWMAFIGNCRHEPAGFAPSWRPRMDDGLLDLRLLHGETPFARVRLVLSILAGRLTASAAYERHLVKRIEVHSDLTEMPLSRDGDTFTGPGSFTVEKLPAAVTVYSPLD